MGIRAQYIENREKTFFNYTVFNFDWEIMMIEVIQDNPFMVVSLLEIQKILRITHEELNESLTLHIKQATRFVEQQIGLSFLIKTYSYKWRATASPKQLYNTVTVPIGPIKEIVLIKSLLHNCRIRRFLVDTETQVFIPDNISRIELHYKAGLAEMPQDIPEEYKHLVILVTQALFEGADLNTHSCMKVIECYKKVSCA